VLGCASPATGEQEKSMIIEKTQRLYGFFYRIPSAGQRDILINWGRVLLATLKRYKNKKLVLLNYVSGEKGPGNARGRRKMTVKRRTYLYKPLLKKSGWVELSVPGFAP